MGRGRGRGREKKGKPYARNDVFVVAEMGFAVLAAVDLVAV